MDRSQHSEAQLPPPILAEVGRPLGLALACFFVAGVAGVGIAIYLRRRGLAWTWSLLLLLPPLSILAATIGGALPLSLAGVVVFALTLGLAFGAGGWGARERLEDRRAGGDREATATRRRGVLDALRRALVERGARRQRLIDVGLPVGRTSRCELACVPRGSAASGSHVLIPGATGAGKTTSLGALLIEYVVRSGFGAVILEAKSDAALCNTAREAAAARGAAFRFVSPEGTAVYDPLAQGEVDERSERLLAAQEWGSGDAEFYRQAASPFLRLVLRVLDRAGERATLARAAALCDPDELENVAMELDGPEPYREVSAAIKALRADERRAIAGMRARLANLASSEFARHWLDPERPGARAIDLREALGRREVLYFRLDTDRTGNVGRAIAQMILLDLGAAASAMMDRGVGTFVGVDEFGALEAPALERLFTRGRAAGFSVALGTQTLADLRAAGPAVRERVGATVSAILCHRLGGQEDAEWIAQLIGTVPTWESTIRTDRWGHPGEEGTRTRGHRFEVHPAELQRLGRGEAYLARLDDDGRRRSARVRVVPAWKRLSVDPTDEKRSPQRLEKKGKR
jgi:Type IV secretion-system coupling protein DNA-binding domain